jgi:hypothetical protein
MVDPRPLLTQQLSVIQSWGDRLSCHHAWPYPPLLPRLACNFASLTWLLSRLQHIQATVNTTWPPGGGGAHAHNMRHTAPYTGTCIGPSDMRALHTRRTLSSNNLRGTLPTEWGAMVAMREL